MNNFKITVGVMIINSCMVYSMDDSDKKIVLHKNPDVPVLSINDYIIPVSNPYKALEKEWLLALLFLKRSGMVLFFKQSSTVKKIERLKQHKREIACSWLFEGKKLLSKAVVYKQKDLLMKADLTDISDVVIEMHGPHVNSEHVSPISLCAGNILCGAGMLGIILLLSFIHK